MLLDDKNDLELPDGAEQVRRHHHTNGRTSRPKSKDDEIPEIVWWIAGGVAIAGVAGAGYMALDNMNKQKIAQQQLLAQQRQQVQSPQSQTIQQRESEMIDTNNINNINGHVQQAKPVQVPEMPHISGGYYADSIKPDMRQEPTGQIEEEEPILKDYSDVNSGQHTMETHQQMKNTIPDNPYLEHMMEEPPKTKKKYKESSVDIFCPAL